MFFLVVGEIRHLFENVICVWAKLTQRQRIIYMFEEVLRSTQRCLGLSNLSAKIHIIREEREIMTLVSPFKSTIWTSHERSLPQGQLQFSICHYLNCPHQLNIFSTTPELSERLMESS